jgi:tetratricopeptide (TPR) repeat protein
MSGVISHEGSFVGVTAEGRTEYPCLIVEASPQADELGLQFILLSAQVILGRDAGCTLELKDPALSPRHAMLSLTPGPSGQEPVVMCSERSTPDVTAMIQLGEVLQLGSTCLRYSLIDLEPQVSQVLETVTGLTREARYDEALSALAALRKFRPTGGSHRTPLEQLLRSARFLEARIHAVLGTWSTAIDLLEELIDSDGPDWELRLKATFQLGILYVHQSDLERALTLVDRMWKLAEGRDGYFLALALCLRGMTASRLRDFSLARRAFRDANAKLQLSTRPTRNLAARVQLELGISHFLAEQHEQALEHFLRLKPEEGDDEVYRVNCAEALRYRAVIHSLRREFAQADTFLREALKTFQAAKWHFLECKALKSLGLNALSWGRLEEAIDHLRRCQELLTLQVENEYERAVCAGQLGKIYLTRGDAQEALRWFEQERRLQSGTPGVAHSQAYTYRNFARAHRNLGNAAQATLYYVRAVATFHEFSNWVQKGLTLVELCRHRLDSREPELAAGELLEAERSFAAAGHGKRFEPTINMLRAQLAWAQGAGTQAQELFATSLQALEHAPPNYLLAEICLSSGRLHVELYHRATQAQAQDMATAGEHYRQAKLLLERGSQYAASQSFGWLLAQFHKELQGLPSLAR